MNFSIVRFILGKVIMIEAMFLILPFIVGIIFKETDAFSFLLCSSFCFITGALLTKKRPKSQLFFAREGFIIVALSWITLSFFGAIPFVLSRQIPNFTDALYETVSGFTTTGSSILADVESLNRSTLFWRSFTHWIGGMGVVVFMLAILPMTGGHNMHLMRAESPGPAVGKLVPRIRDTAKMLYIIYLALTIIQIIILLIAGMPFFDALLTAFSTAGTGGYTIKNSSMAAYSTTIQTISAIFMILYGMNFNAYYFILVKKKINFFKIEEIQWYLGIIFVSTFIIMLNIKEISGSLIQAFHDAFFQVSTIITTTGYTTADFNIWPNLSKTILIILMFIGSCAGSTGGGIKVSRIIILFKLVKKELGYFIHPRGVKVIKMEERAVAKETSDGVATFIATYIIIFTISFIILSLDNFDMMTNFTAVASSINNAGVGMGLIGPGNNYGMFSDLSKYVLMFNMLAGRLELYPLLILFTPSVWKKS